MEHPLKKVNPTQVRDLLAHPVHGMQPSNKSLSCSIIEYMHDRDRFAALDHNQCTSLISRETMDVQGYLDHIGVTGPKPDRADLATLKKLHNCHQTSVPFENLDAMSGTITNLTMWEAHCIVHCGQRLGFVDLAWVVPLSAIFGLGSCKCAEMSGKIEGLQK